MFKERLISSIIFAPSMLILAYLGGYFLLAAVLFIFYAGLKEYVNILANKGITLPHKNMLVLALVFAIVAFFLPNSLGLGVALSFAILTIWVLRYRVDFASFAFAVCGMIYICWGGSHIISLRQMDGGVWILLYCLILPWVTDAGAYIVGILIGKHKLIPSVSPKKTWEGAIGGVVICILISLIYNHFIFETNPIIMALIAGLGAVIAQVGDLLESWLKRWGMVKDSGQFMPGHGGVLDRFDSMLFVAPYLYYVFLLL